MNRSCFILLLLLAVPLQAGAQAKLEAQLKKRADQFQSSAKSDHASASSKHDSASFDLAFSVTELSGIKKRYNKVKNALTQAEEDYLVAVFKYGEGLHITQSKLLVAVTKEYPDGGPIYKEIAKAKKCLDAGETLYGMKAWSLAATEFGACSAQAKAASVSLSKSLKDLSALEAHLKESDKILKKYEE